MNKKIVCFLMPTISKSAEPASQIISRCRYLAERFRRVEGWDNSEVIMLGSGLFINKSEIQNSGDPLKVFSLNEGKINSLLYLIKSYKILRIYHGHKITLVAGDNYKALFISLILKKLIGSKTAVQVSIHGNPFTSSSSRLKSTARRFAFKHLVRRASSVRFVSEHLRYELGSYISAHATWFVSPIPTQFSHEIEEKSGAKSLGIVGRLHSERGIDLVCRILNRLSELNVLLNTLIIGDGPEKSKITDFMVSNPRYPIDFRGTLPKPVVLESFKSIRMLLNCAPSEGYGLAMREAILSGTPVIALRNEGTSELKSKFPEMVFLFSTVDEAVLEIEAHFGQGVSLDLVKKYRQEQAASDEIAVQSLIDSWR